MGSSHSRLTSNYSKNESKRNVKVEIILGKRKHDSLYIFDFSSNDSEKIASFDLDDTIIETLSKKIFPKNENDWKLKYSTTKSKLKNAYDEGYKIVIFTNQNNVGRGLKTIEEFEKKFIQIQKKLELPLIFFVASADDEFRKPGIGMWKYFLDQYSKENIINYEKSFYVGDAAGRKEGIDGINDFSDCDIKFAINVRLPFKYPEEFFLNSKKVPKFITSFYPSEIISSFNTQNNEGEHNFSEIMKRIQEIILFVGPPGGGKTTFWKNYIYNYYRIIIENNEKPENKQIFRSKVKFEIEKNRNKAISYVIDGSNSKREDRKYIIDIAKENNLPIRCFYFDVSPELANHLNAQISKNKFRLHLSPKVNSQEIKKFFIDFENPTLIEGFYEIKKIPFMAIFENEQDKCEFLLLT